MIGEVIRFVLTNFTATFPAIGFIIALILVLVRKPDKRGVWMTFLNWFLLLGIGIAYFYNGIMHTFFGEVSAAHIGWEDNGFQTEVGFASFGMGILGIFASLKNMPMSTKFAALIVPTCFLWGAAGTHILDIIKTGNMHAGNAGTVLYTDILIPVIGFILWYGAYKTSQRKAVQR